MYRIQTDHFSLELKPYEQNTYSAGSSNRIRVIVSSYGFSADSYIDTDALHLASFAEKLYKVYETLQGSARLEDMYGGRCYIALTAIKGGHISVDGRLNNKEAYGYEQELLFNNAFDQTYLQNFAKRLYSAYGTYAD